SVNVSDDERARLTAVQQMLAEKLELEESLARIGQGMDSRAELRAKLVSLRTKMQRLGLEVYAPRIASMTAGIAAIDQQLELEARLRDAYERSIAMLEIELEAGAAVDAMEGMDAPHIAATFAEMRELEEQQKELTQQITANAVASAAPTLLAAQGTAADYTRAERLNARFQGLALHVPERATWIGNTDHFWYRRSVQGGNEFVVVDAATKEKHPAFDHAKLAAALDSAAQTHFTATTLPFLDIALADDEHAVQFVAAGFNWRCTLTEYSCLRLTAATTGGRGGRGGPSVDDNGDVVPFEGPWDENDGLGAEVLQQRAEQFGGAQRADSVSRRSPDGAHEAFIQNYNVY